MATQTVEFRAASGATLAAKLFSVGSDTVVQTASAVVESGNRKGTYSSLFADVPAGEYELIAFSGAVPVCRWFVTLTLTTATFQAYDGPAKLAAITHTGARVPNVTVVDTCTTNTDMRGTDNAALASAWTSTRAGYLDSVLLAANSNQRTVLVTGSNHVAADIHELQAAVITDAAFAAGWLTAAGTAADFITELQTALGTAANQTAILDRVSFALSALAGNCSTAQTATETYVLSIGGNTYTAAYSGLDGSGNRSTTTLTKA